MKSRNVFLLKSDTEYDEYGSNPYDFRFNEISMDASSDKLENVILKHIVLHGTLIKDLSISGFNCSENSIYSSIYNRVYAYNCNFTDSNIDKLYCKQSSSSGIPGNSFYQGFIINKLSFSGIIINNSNIGNLYTYKTTFYNLQINKSYFRANLFKKTDFSLLKIKNVDLSNVVFKNCKLTDIKLNAVSLKNVIFDNCTIDNLSFISSKVENIKFIECNLKNINWGNIDLRREFFINLKPSKNTLGASHRSIIKYITFYDYKELGEFYLYLKNYFRGLGRYNDMSWAYLKEKESERLNYIEELKKLNFPSNYFYINEKNINKPKIILRKVRYIFLYFIEILKYLLFGYGERPGFILAWSIFTIIFFSIIYFFTSSLHSVYPINPINSYFNNLYYSTITFTTVGFGDFIPIRMISKFLTMAESLLGLFFYSLFVFSFGRRFAGR